MGCPKPREQFGASRKRAIRTGLVGAVKGLKALCIPRDEMCPEDGLHHVRLGGIWRVVAPILVQRAPKGSLQSRRIGEQQQALGKALRVPNDVEEAQQGIESTARLGAGHCSHVVIEGRGT